MRLIDADALEIKKAKREIFSNPSFADGWNSVIDIIQCAPTVNAEPIRQGHWIYTDYCVCGYVPSVAKIQQEGLGLSKRKNTYMNTALIAAQKWMEEE